MTWVINKTEAALVQGTEGCEFIIFDKRLGWSGYRAVWRALADRRFDALLMMHASMRANVLSLGIRASRRIGFDKNRARDFQRWFTNERIEPQPRAHVVDGFFGFVRHLGIETHEPQWSIPIDDEARSFAASARATGRPLIVVSPLSSQRSNNFRNWSVERYTDVCRYAIETHRADIVITGGGRDDEHDYANKIRGRLGSHVRSLVGATTLKSLLAVIAEADAVIAPDSGPVHMAVATGTPAIGLYATSNPDRTGPYRGREHIVNEYPKALQQFLGKSVDDVRWGQRVRDPAALDLISVEAVCRRIDQVLGGTKRG
ncbi:MAG: glycosyltransferase family 9 protein [Pseudomonadota bacterium]